MLGKCFFLYYLAVESVEVQMDNPIARRL